MIGYILLGILIVFIFVLILLDIIEKWGDD